MKDTYVKAAILGAIGFFAGAVLFAFIQPICALCGTGARVVLSFCAIGVIGGHLLGGSIPDGERMQYFAGVAFFIAAFIYFKSGGRHYQYQPIMFAMGAICGVGIGWGWNGLIGALVGAPIAALMLPLAFYLQNELGSDKRHLQGLGEIFYHLVVLGLFSKLGFALMGGTLGLALWPVRDSSDST